MRLVLLRWLLLALCVIAPAAAHAQDLCGYHLTYDNEFQNGIKAGPPGTPGTNWETSVSYGSLDTGNNGTVNPTAPGQPGSQFSTGAAGLNMAVTPQYSPYLDTGAPDGFTQQYGYFEASVKQASSASGGTWSAFWMTPTSGPWPPEFDIFEGDGTMASFTNHGGDIHTPVNTNFLFNRPDLSAGFHTYGFAWTPTTLTWYLDGQEVFSAPTADNERQPMMMILSAYNKGATDPTAMQVAWVHAYSNDPSTPTAAAQPGYQGHACTNDAPGSAAPVPASPVQASSPPFPPPSSGLVTADLEPSLAGPFKPFSDALNVGLASSNTRGAPVSNAPSPTAGATGSLAGSSPVQPAGSGAAPSGATAAMAQSTGTGNQAASDSSSVVPNDGIPAMVVPEWVEVGGSGFAPPSGSHPRAAE